MAKKKNGNTLQYLQMPLTNAGKYTKMTQIAFGGLNKRYTIDSGELSMEKNISTKEYPYLTPSESREPVFNDGYNKNNKVPISMSAFDDFLIVVYRENDTIKVDYITYDGNIFTGLIKSSGATKADEEPRSIIQFNVYDTPTDTLTGDYVKKLIFFPDKASMYMKIEVVGENPASWKDDELNSARTDVMYCYDNGRRYYYTIKILKNTDKDGKVTYTRQVKQCGTSNCFVCDGLDVVVKEYRNETSEVDKSGATIYPPPANADKNCYYRNTYNNDVYKWVQYNTAIKNPSGEWVDDGGIAYGWKVSIPPNMPTLKHATVHLSRVFGVDDDRVYASGFNDYTNWNLDTAGESNESNAWCSPSQSNTKASGNFTGITTFLGHVICFKQDFMHEIYNTKNPFRLQDVYAEGTIDGRTIQDVDGKLIFASTDDVKMYTGSNPRVIGQKLNFNRIEYAVSGTDNRNYFLYCEDRQQNRYLYVYDTLTEMWSEQSIDYKVLSFAYNKTGMYMFCDDGAIYKIDSNVYSHNWSFETDLVTVKTVDIKHVKKLQMLVDIPDKVNNRSNKNAHLKVYILYDDEEFNEETSHLVYTSKKNGKFPIRVKPRKTANYGFKLHFEGYGYVKLYELETHIEAGGDLFV